MTNIVMLVRNRYRLTEQALESLYTHTPRNEYNLTIIDDDSDDFRTRRLVDQWGNMPHVNVLRVLNSGHRLGQLKNLGVEWSCVRFGQGEHLCLCDNDVYFCEGWLEVMTEFVRSTAYSGFALFGGQQHPYHLPHGNSSVSLEVNGKKYEMREYLALPGTHWFMDWPTWDNFPGLPDKQPGVCMGEDTEYCQILRNSGLRIGAITPHVVLDCGWTNTNGEPAPGYELRVDVPGVYHE